MDSNRTLRILAAASSGPIYGVGAFNLYNTDGVLAVIRAATQLRSPAIIQLLPWSLHHHGAAWIRFVLEAAHTAPVPIAVHLDHSCEPADVELALSLGFDSVMVDGETAYVRSVVEEAAKLGIAVEGELGKVAGVEDGVKAIPEGRLTRPEEARAWVEETGVRMLAPSFGNVHGGYGKSSPEEAWDLERLAEIRKGVPGDIPLVLHGTFPAGDSLIRDVIQKGVVKINMNRHVREGYGTFLKENAGLMELTQLMETGVNVYQNEVERVMKEVLGSAGRAGG